MVMLAMALALVGLVRARPWAKAHIYSNASTLLDPAHYRSTNSVDRERSTLFHISTLLASQGDG